MAIIGLISGLHVLWNFNFSGDFALPFALVALGTVCVGTLLSLASVMLFSIAKLREDTERNISRLFERENRLLHSSD